MKRSWHIWVAFTFCLAVVLAAMGWISWKALRLDRAESEARRHEAEARRETALEQEVRLASYRMDNALTPLVARESARPYFAYHTFLPVDRAFGQMFNTFKGPERLAISPLLNETSPDVLVHFQFDPEGRLTCPRVPDPSRRSLVVPEHISAEAVREAETRLARLAEIVDRESLFSMLPDESLQPTPLVMLPVGQLQQQVMADAQPGPQGFEVQRRQRNVAEYNFRSQALRQSAANVLRQNPEMNLYGETSLPSTDVGGVVMTPLWIDGHLVLARRVRVSDRQYVQGCLLDWAAIKAGLLTSIRDLLPQADLQPVTSLADAGASGMLAALPVRLIPGHRTARGGSPGQASGGEPLPETSGLVSPIHLSLLIAWACVLLGAAAVALLLHGVIRLSERRGAFVSAVTHELRTPLTTFHMYTEMLDEGMVPEEGRGHYLKTLRSEASRLAHLVENVLAYARLERGRTDGRIENLPLDGLLGPIESRLADRARQDGMELVVEADEAALCGTVRANPSAVEQILLNLVDNAVKYAAAASDKRIHLAVEPVDARIHLRIRDHGPGISAGASRRLFHSFTKSAHEAANSAPGVGLGLALSRRLARDMGARLWLDKSVQDGACFVLSLPAADQPG